MFSDQTLDLEKGKNVQISICFDTEHLTPGKYRVDIIAYITDSLGEDHYIDGIYPAFVFEITDKINETNKKVWHQHYWGAIHLQDIEVGNIDLL